MKKNLIFLAIFAVSVILGIVTILNINKITASTQIASIAAPVVEVRQIITYPLAWEEKNPSRKEWSKHLYFEIDKNFDSFTAQDITYFCPNYDNLQKEEQINVWGQIICMMAFYESSWNPNVRFVEPSLGIDPVTNRTNTSEGLLQLGYADSLYHKCSFDWEKDKDLDDDDPKKTIFNPYINLSCGVKILAKQIATHKAIVINRGAYWSVIKMGHRNNKVPQIINTMSRFPPCVMEEN